MNAGTGIALSRTSVRTMVRAGHTRTMARAGHTRTMARAGERARRAVSRHRARDEHRSEARSAIGWGGVWHSSGWTERGRPLDPSRAFTAEGRELGNHRFPGKQGPQRSEDRSEPRMVSRAKRGERSRAVGGFHHLITDRPEPSPRTRVTDRPEPSGKTPVTDRDNPPATRKNRTSTTEP